MYTPGYAPSAVISDSLWRRRFAADPNVLGRTIGLTTVHMTLPACFPPDFGIPDDRMLRKWTYGSPPDSKPNPTQNRRAARRAFPSVIGRLKTGITLQQAQARLTAMAAEIRRDFPADYPADARWSIEIEPLQEDLVGKVRPMLLVLFRRRHPDRLHCVAEHRESLLARASGRQQEIAVRSALGASRGRIISQMLTEAVLLAVTGGLAGLLRPSHAEFRFALRPVQPSPDGEVNIDWFVLLFALLVSLLSGLLFGLAPALHSTRSTSVRDAQRVGYSVNTSRLRDALIVSELALAVVLMIGAGLLLRTLQDLFHENPGFNPTQVVAANVNLPFPGDPKKDPYSTIARQSTFYHELERRMKEIPGVELTGFVSDLPAAGLGFNFALGIEDRPSNSSEDLRAKDILVSPDYFKVMQTPLIRGRFFTGGDADGRPRVAIIDESTAHRYWPDRDPLGRRIRMGQGAWMTIVGITRDIKQDGLDVNGVPHVYVPMYQEFDVAEGYVFRDFAIVLRTTLGANALAPQIRHQVHSVDPRLPVYSVSSMNELLDRSLAARRFSADLVSGFAGMALLLASIGIYGLLAYMVSQRSREIGLRMALGAARVDILKLIVTKGVVLAGAGIATGLLLSASTASLMASLLYGVRPRDPAVFLAVPLLLFAVAVLASYLPARRAIKVDPLAALREI